MCGFVRDSLVAKLGARSRKRGKQTLRLLDATSAHTSYAWLIAAPIGRLALNDTEFRCWMRLRLGAPILHPGSRRCKTVTGADPKRCTLLGCARGSADAHAASCKAGGHSIRSHNAVRVDVASLARSWTVPVSEETGDLMTAGSAAKMDILAPSAGAGRGPLAADFTRRFGADAAALAAAEAHKERKYGQRYTVPLTLRGWAFDEVGRCGAHGIEAGEALVAAGVRAGAGHSEDLSLELWATFGVALARATTRRFARAAAVNHDRSAYAPQERDLVAHGQRRATGAGYAFQPQGNFGPPRGPHSVAILPRRAARRARPPRGWATPPLEASPTRERASPPPAAGRDSPAPSDASLLQDAHPGLTRRAVRTHSAASSSVMRLSTCSDPPAPQGRGRGGSMDGASFAPPPPPPRALLGGGGRGARGASRPVPPTPPPSRGRDARVSPRAGSPPHPATQRASDITMSDC